MSQIQPFKFEPEYATDEEREESLSSSQSSSKDDEKASRIGEQSWCESQMLHHYVSNQKEIGKNDLRITYFISGWQSVNSLKRLKSFVVKEDNLEKVKSLFDQISSLHIYSIQRCKLLDYNALIIADYNKLKETKFSNSILSSESACNERLKHGQSDSTHMQKDPLTISNPDAKFSSENSRILKTVSAPVASKNSTVPKEDFKTSSKPKSKGIAAMFNKNPSSTVSTSDKKVESKGKNVSVKSGKGIVGMLAKQAEKSNNSDKSKVDKENTSFNKSEKENGKCSKSPDMSERTDENISVSKKKIDCSSKEKLKSKKAVKSVNRKKSQPRKRIRIMESESSSSSEDEEPEEEITEPVVLDFGDDPIKEEPESKEDVGKVKVAAGPKNKKRKLVDKTYIEDGFMVTNKVWESCSESESEELEPKPESKPADRVKPVENHKKKTSNSVQKSKKQETSKSKQVTLMNFFKKKN
ncbi:DNA polymerase delta subunit 3 [Nymphon striatum]|nr:DNA polymerase delta subunit 3 [Nymphon striatum]